MPGRGQLKRAAKRPAWLQQLEEPPARQARRDPERPAVIDQEEEPAQAAAWWALDQQQPATPVPSTSATDPPELLSEEEKELEELLKTYSELYQQTPHFWKLKQSQSTEFDWEDFVNHVTELKKPYHIMHEKKYSLALRPHYLQKAAESLVSSGSVPVLCDLILEIWQKRLSYTEDEASRQRIQDPVQDKLLSDALSALWNFTDAHQVTCRAIIEHGKFLPELVKQMQALQELYIKDELNLDAEQVVVRAGTSILHNVGRREKNVQYLRKLPGIMELLKTFITIDNEAPSVSGDSDKPLAAAQEETHVNVVRFISLLTFAAIATDKEADALATTKGVLEFLMSLVRAALFDSHHRTQTFSFTELIQAVKDLSRNEANSRQLVNEGALPLLTKGLKSVWLKERKGCIESLWWLSFLEENREEILKCEGLLDQVISIYHNKEDPCHSSAEGVLFQIRENLRKHENKEYSSLADQLKGDPDAQSKKSGHVMLSYTQVNRPVVKKVYDYLKRNGIPVWMDIHDMAKGESSVLQTMAEAVEGSFVFLMCYSDGYKNSQYCRQEAEYASAKKKPIVPLRMQDYEPDGWLGFLLGEKFFYDFSRQDLHHQKLTELQQTIKKAEGHVSKETAQKVQTDCPDGMDYSHGGVSYASVAVNSLPLSSVQKIRCHTLGLKATPSLSRGGLEARLKIQQWGKDDVTKWLQKFELKGESLEALTGLDIVSLRHMYDRAPDSFYQLITGQPDLKKVTEVSKLAYALEELDAPHHDLDI